MTSRVLWWLVVLLVVFWVGGVVLRLLGTAINLLLVLALLLVAYNLFLRRR